MILIQWIHNSKDQLTSSCVASLQLCIIVTYAVIIIFRTYMLGRIARVGNIYTF